MSDEMRQGYKPPIYRDGQHAGLGYPATAGYTEESTSKDAADAIEDSGRADTLRRRVLLTLVVEQRLDMTPWSPGLTADEVAAELGEFPFSIRPRITELSKQNLIEKTGERARLRWLMSPRWILSWVQAQLASPA